MRYMLRMADQDDDIADWTRRALKTAKKTQTFLAGVLGVHKSQISRLLRGERDVTYDEVLKIAAALGVPEPKTGGLKPSADFGGVPVRGRVADHAWVSDTASAIQPVQMVGAIIHQRFPVKDQSAYQIDAPAVADEPFRRGDYVVAVPFEKYRSRALPGDLLVLIRRRAGLLNYTLRRAVSEGDRIVLKPVLENSEMDAEWQIHALVIGGYQHFV